MTKLSYESLRKINDIGNEFDQELHRMVQDCRERPFKKQKRTVVFKVELQPVVDDEAGSGSVKVDVTAGVLAKRPPLQTNTNEMTFSSDGEQLEFTLPTAPKSAPVRRSRKTLGRCDG